MGANAGLATTWSIMGEPSLKMLVKRTHVAMWPMSTLVFRAVGVGVALEHDDPLAMGQPATPHEAVDFQVKGYQLAMATHEEKNTRAA